MKKKHLLELAVAAALLTAMFVPLGATADANTGSNPSSADCLGAERSLRNSNGGDRQHGGFGPVQADWVKQMKPYGQWLQEWTAKNC